MSEKAQPDSAKWDASILQRPFWARDVNRDDRDEAESSCDFLELASITQECDLHLSSSGIVTLPDFVFIYLPHRPLSRFRFVINIFSGLCSDSYHSGIALSLLFIECELNKDKVIPEEHLDETSNASQRMKFVWEI